MQLYRVSCICIAMRTAFPFHNSLTYFPSFSLDCRAVLAFHSFPLFVYRPFYFHVSFLFSIHVPVRATCSDGPFAWKIAWLFSFNNFKEISLIIVLIIFCVLRKILSELERIRDFCFWINLRSVKEMLCKWIVKILIVKILIAKH